MINIECRLVPFRSRFIISINLPKTESVVPLEYRMPKIYFKKNTYIYINFVRFKYVGIEEQVSCCRNRTSYSTRVHGQ